MKDVTFPAFLVGMAYRAPLSSYLEVYELLRDLLAMTDEWPKKCRFLPKSTGKGEQIKRAGAAGRNSGW